MNAKTRVRGRRTRNKLSVEPLEARRLLAGDVVVSLAGSGVLRLLGDASDNMIQISATDDLVTIAGIDTTILGPAEFSLDQIQNLKVQLGDGNDGLRIGGHAHDVTAEESGEEDHDEPRLLFPNTVNVDLGDGDDRLKISFVEVAGSLNVVAGLGNDAIDIGRGPGYGGEDHGDDPHAAMPVEPAADDNHDDGGGCGGDHGDAGPPPDVSVAGHVQIDSGSGDDAVKVGFTHVIGRVEIDTGAGQDVVVVGRGPLFRRDWTAPGGGCEEVPATVYGLETLNEAVEGLEVVSGEHTEGGCGGGDEGHVEGGPPPDVRIEGHLSITTGMDGGGDKNELDSDAVSVAFTHTDGNLRIDTGSGADLIVTGRGPLFGQHGGGGGSGGGGGGAGGGGGGGCGDHAAVSNETSDGVGPVASTGGHSRRPVDFRVGGSLFVTPGGGDDMVVLRNTRVATESLVKDLDGNSMIATLNFRGKETARFHTGSEDDTVALLASCFAGDLAVKTGSGRDLVALDGTSISGAFAVHSGAGDDQLVMQSCTFANVAEANMGHDDDTLAARRNVFATSGAIDGGQGGNDLYLGLGSDENESAIPLTLLRFTPALEVFPYDVVFAELDDLFGAFLPG